MKKFLKEFLVFSLILGGILMFMFRDLLNPHNTLFSNDGPLGYQVSEQWSGTIKDGPGTPFWMDSFWLGINGGVVPASFSYTLMWILYNPLYVYRGVLVILFSLCVWYIVVNFNRKRKEI